MIPEFFSESTKNWFKTAVGEPTPVQEEAWRAVAAGGDVLISAPTGTGKTLAAFLYALDGYAAAPGTLEERCGVIYVSPLKALGNDIRENLKRPLEGLGLAGTVRTAVRTGDTTQAERARMLRHPPHILITTPESLHLMLTSESSRRMLSHARSVIIDEVHSVMGSKRGAHLMLSLERLDALCGRRLQRIALSATVQPLDVAAMFVSGGRGARVIAPNVKKALEIRVELAEKDMRVLPEHSIWPSIAEKAYELSKNARTMLAFVDGRQQAEKLAHGINAIAGHQYARTHHGCVSKEQRLEAERQLREGELKILCCTSSMELGIDVGDIDLVLQIGAPRSIAGELQRAGRAGHGPGRVSSLLIYPKTGADSFAAALAARGALEGRIESVRPPEKCLDVLAQHLVAMANAGSLTVDEALETVNGAWNFRNVTREELEGVLCMLAGDFEHAREAPVRPRLIYDRLNGVISGDSYTRMLAFSNVGTIPDRGWYGVYLTDGTRLGELDEEYVYEARLGDKFLLGAFAWRIHEITRDRVIVTPATPEGAQPPFWKGDTLGRPIETGRYYGALMREMNAARENDRLERVLGAYPVSADARTEVRRHIESQVQITGCLPDDRTIIAEHFSDSAGEHQLMIHSVFGMRVNRVISMLLRHIAARETGLDVRGYDDDDGMLLYLLGGSEMPEGLLSKLEPEGVEQLVNALLPAEPAFSMAYRYAAARAGMMGLRSRGRQPLWVQRIRGAESLSGAVDQAGHPLIAEALRECRDDLMDIEGAKEIIREIRAGTIRVIEMHAHKPSPMSLPLRRQVEAELMYELAIPVKAKEHSRSLLAGIAPDKAAVDKRFERARKIADAEMLHSALMMEGDMVPGEADAPAEWFEHLAAQGRALYIEPGLWIAAEHAADYADGPTERIVRRLIRFRGAQDARSVAQRYAITEERAGEMLASLEKKGEAARFEGMYIHPDVYSSAQRLTLSMRRSEVQTVPPGRFAQLMAARADIPGAPKARLSAAMDALLGVELSASAWEDIVLPRRVPGYRGEMLDALLAEGGIVCALRAEDDRRYVQFRAAEDFEFDQYVPAEGCSREQAEVLRALERGGAQFDYVISKRLGGAPVLAQLQALAEIGLVRQDSFAPVRRMLNPRSREAKQSNGRWERAAALRELDADALIAACFRRCPILCRETCQGVSWTQALERLRVMEMEGTARRGYFVSGLSGAQFTLSKEFAAVTAALAVESGEYVCLNAADPAQMWGRTLKHAEGREFMCVPGTCVVLRGGTPVCVFEKSGAALRMFEPDTYAVKCFADAFRARRVFPGRSRVCVKTYPDCAAEMLESAGFMREALDYVLYSD